MAPAATHGSRDRHNLCAASRSSCRGQGGGHGAWRTCEKRRSPIPPGLNSFFIEVCLFLIKGSALCESIGVCEQGKSRSARYHESTARRRPRRAQGRSASKPAVTRTLTATPPAGWRGSGRLGANGRTERVSLDTKPVTWPRRLAMVGMLGSS